MWPGAVETRVAVVEGRWARVGEWTPSPTQAWMWPRSFAPPGGAVETAGRVRDSEASGGQSSGGRGT